MSNEMPHDVEIDQLREALNEYLEVVKTQHLPDEILTLAKELDRLIEDRKSTERG